MAPLVYHEKIFRARYKHEKYKPKLKIFYELRNLEDKHLQLTMENEGWKIPPVETGISPVDCEIPPDGDTNPPVTPPEEENTRSKKIIEFCSEPYGILEIADMLRYKDKKTVCKYLTPLLT